MTFEDRSARLMRRLLKDIPQWGVLEAAACMGNGGGESGLEAIPQTHGTAFGYWQWDGPRKRAFYDYTSLNGWKPTDEEANYRFLICELKGSESATVAKVKAATKADFPGHDDLYAKTRTFERTFERAGVPAWDERYKWAKRALAAYRSNSPTPAVFPGGDLGDVPMGHIPPPPDLSKLPPDSSAPASWWDRLIAFLRSIFTQPMKG